jgi:molybdate transport repressor ModE-like protein
MELAAIVTLAAVARNGSISAAAKRQGVSVSTAARRLDSLEASLKLRLVDRRVNGAVLTPEGLRIAALAAPVADQLAAIARAAAALADERAEATVRVSVTESIAAELLAPALPRLRTAAPTVRVQLQIQSELVSLAGRETDLAVRMSPPQGASLLARKLAVLRVGLWASPAWLAGRDPAAIDLPSSPILAYDDSFGRLPELQWLDRLGLTGAVVLRTGSSRALFAATCAGAGIGLLDPNLFGAGHGLVPLPTAEPAPPRTPYLIVHRDIRREPAVAAVHRWIVDTFRRALGGNVARPGRPD